MPEELLGELLAASRQELARLQDPRNRQKYFIFGKLAERLTENGYDVTFEVFPSPCRHDASQPTGKHLFKIGDLIVEGVMSLQEQGHPHTALRVVFPYACLRSADLDPTSLAALCDHGIEYIMDTRQFVEHTVECLDKTDAHGNPLLLDLAAEGNDPVELGGIYRHITAIELNSSQHAAIEKALRRRVTYCWGPPGTGKTRTLAALAAYMVMTGRRVLISATANTALDQLLSKTLEALDNISSSSPTIGRLGKTHDDRCSRLTREHFGLASFASPVAGELWRRHTARCRLLAGTFAAICHPAHRDFVGDFDYIIADEVSMAAVPTLVAVAGHARLGFIAGGDPLQLPPVFPEDPEIANEWYSENIFERASIRQVSDPRAAFLSTQYRMHSDIGDVVSLIFYDGDLQTGTHDETDLKVFGSRVAFLQTPGPMGHLPTGTGQSQLVSRRFNETHARGAVDAARIAVRHGMNAADIGIIAPYNAQVMMIKSALKLFPALEEVKVATVHSFQGQEKGMMIVDFTDDNTAKTPLTAKRELVNVAISRAKHQLVMVGNRDYLTKSAHLTDDDRAMFGDLIGSAHKIVVKRRTAS